MVEIRNFTYTAIYCFFTTVSQIAVKVLSAVNFTKEYLFHYS